jgi:hypothetical protein
VQAGSAARCECAASECAAGDDALAQEVEDGCKFGCRIAQPGRGGGKARILGLTGEAGEEAGKPGAFGRPRRVAQGAFGLDQVIAECQRIGADGARGGRRAVSCIGQAGQDQRLEGGKAGDGFRQEALCARGDGLCLGLGRAAGGEARSPPP